MTDISDETGIQPQHETAIAATTAHAKAAVEARFKVALGRPRDLDLVREKVLKDCRRPRFAEAARYRRPVGGGKTAEGPSIRFAESALRNMGNLDVTTPTIYDDERKRIIQVVVTDLESNATLAKDVTVEKVVERKQLKQGQKPLGSRLNSYGDLVYLVTANESDLTTKEAALISKAMRTLVLRLVPADIVEEAMDRCIATQADADKKDPDAARKRLADAFAELGVSVAELKRYLGHELSQCSPAELADLRAVYAAVRDGETTWADVMRERTAIDAEGESKPVEEKPRSKSASQRLKQRKQQAEEPPEETFPEKFPEGEESPDAEAERLLGLVREATSAKEVNAIYDANRADIDALPAELAKQVVDACGKRTEELGGEG